MKIYLAGTASYRNLCENNPPRFLLESFYYFQDWQFSLMQQADDFLLDSGAFTFMQGKTKTPDFDEYCERYADFIKRNNISHFFELDIDSVVGYQRVLSLRRKLELLVEKRCIPVWHKSRGMEEYRKMCDAYDYVAIGGIVSQEILSRQYKFLPVMIAEAHKRGARIHGLGFTSTSYYDKIHFDSVDSTTWTVGARMGNLCYFNGQGMRQYKPNGKRPKDINALHKANYEAWLKFQKYAEERL